MKRQRAQEGRPKLPKVDPEMQRWSALLEEEVSSWPDVTSRPMFGLGGYYRQGRIFAAIPRTRAIETPFSLLIKLPGAPDARPRTKDGPPRGGSRGARPGAGWVTFAMESDADLSEALRQLGRAYEQATEPKSKAAATTKTSARTGAKRKPRRR